MRQGQFSLLHLGRAVGVHAEKDIAMVPAKLGNTLSLSHSRTLQHNVRSLRTMKGALHWLRRMVHNPTLPGENDLSISQGYGVCFRQIPNQLF